MKIGSKIRLVINVFDNEINLSKEFKLNMEKLTKENPMLEPWKWQSIPFNENIIETVNENRKFLKQFLKNYKNEYIKFKNLY